MGTVEWLHARPGCGTCERLRELLRAAAVDVARESDATSEPMAAAAALKVARAARRIVVEQRGRTVEVDMRTRPSDGQLRELLLDPKGNLRVPAWRLTGTLYVGLPKDGLPAGM